MIVGNGMIASAFDYYKNNPNVIIFASGVSDSKETKKKSFDRERQLLIKTICDYKGEIFVYFSTCSVYDNSVNTSAYVVHKKCMELIVKNNCTVFYIFRLPQVVGNTNSPTLINYLYLQIKNNHIININKYSTRNIIAATNVFYIIKYIIKNKIFTNSTTNIATPYNMSVVDIVQIMEKIIGKKARIKLLNLGEKNNINLNKVKTLPVFNEIFNSEYVNQVLLNYINNREEIRKYRE